MASHGNGETLRFIDDYKDLPQLWDVNHKLYTNQSSRRGCLQELGNKYKLSVEEVKKKIKNLRSYFAKELTKEKTKKSESGLVDVYKSPWFGFKPLMFLTDSITPHRMQVLRLPSMQDEDDDETPLVADNSDALSDGDVSSPSEDSLPQYNCIEPTTSTSNRKKQEDPFVEEEAYNIMKTAASRLASRDDSDIFGEYVAVKVKRLTPRNRSIAENRILNVLFSLEMAQIASDPSTSSSHSAGNNEAEAQDEGARRKRKRSSVDIAVVRLK